MKEQKRSLMPVRLMLGIFLLAALAAAMYFYLQGKKSIQKTEGLVYDCLLYTSSLPEHLTEEAM